MKNNAKEILDNYLNIYDEKDKLSILSDFLDKYNEDEIIDWNNFYGHIVASAFVYSKSDKLFLTLYHKEFNTYIYPGGHIIKEDNTILDAAKREVKEEIGIKDIKVININNNELILIDIDIHNIAYNKKLDLPPHYHFDFRYFFSVDEIKEVILDNESEDYKWISLEEIKNNPHYGHIYKKLENIVNNL